MLDLEELRQLAAFARWGTLSRAAEELHISQPTLSRTMQSLEEEFGVSLFIREKNKIELNETGRRAVEVILQEGTLPKEGRQQVFPVSLVPRETTRRKEKNTK